MNKLKRILLISAGLLCVVFGLIGAFVPIMPSLPFFILASVCFSKSSKKFHNFLLDNKLVGPYIKKYHENNGITLKAKIVFIIIQWVCMLSMYIFFIHNTIGRALMVIIAIGFSAYILSLKTAK